MFSEDQNGFSTVFFNMHTTNVRACIAVIEDYLTDSASIHILPSTN